MGKLWLRTVLAALLAVALLFVVTAARADEAAAEPATEPAHAAEPAEPAHAGHHAPTFDDINWYYGMLWESEGVAPSLLFRPKGMPVPFLGWLFNAIVLYAVVYRFAKDGVKKGLERRKATIQRGMNDAARLKAEAEARLADYEEKLARIEDEVERVRREMREAGESERARILSEARARRERMERDAKLLIDQELAAARDLLVKETVQAAVRAAKATLEASVTSADQGRLAEEYLAGLPKTVGVTREHA